MNLLVDWCSYEAAKYAVEHWHYSGNLPSFGRRLTAGIWEDGEFVGAIVYAYSATPNIAKGLHLDQTEVVELRRVAMKEHKMFVSVAIARSLKLVKAHCPGLRLIVSFADIDHDHIGIIYQASNWIYTGSSMHGVHDGFIVKGLFIHRRTVGTYGRGKVNIEWVRSNMDSEAKDHYSVGKHRYLYPLDKGMRRQILPLAQPYPKRGQGVQGDTPTVLVGELGSSPRVRSDMTGGEPELVI